MKTRPERLGRPPLATITVCAGLLWSVAFVAIALPNQLELYGDGAMFSYAVAVRDVWAFHWHNIAGRTSVYLLTLLPGEWLAARHPWAGVMAYGFLFYVGPLVGLVFTYAIDRSNTRAFFLSACASTAILCPLIFGFPTEMWLAHAIFWPVLTMSHTANRRIGVSVILFAAWLLLAFTHEGAIVLLAAIVATLSLHGYRSAIFLRGAINMGAVLVIAAAVKIICPPDDYYADAFWRAAFHFFDPDIFKVRIVQLLLSIIAIFLAIYAIMWRRGRTVACSLAFATSFTLLLAYWLVFDNSIHASDRYYLRTFLVIAIPVFGGAAALAAIDAPTAIPGWLDKVRWTLVSPSPRMARIGLSLFALITAIHVVETCKFLSGWRDYRSAVAQLAQGKASNPELGDPHFVSAARLSSTLAPLSWFSTSPYLSILLSDFVPHRLVIDPTGNYFWLSCATATRNRDAPSPVPAPARELVRIYSCKHRPG